MKKQLIYLNEVPDEFKQHENLIKEEISRNFNLLDFDCKVEIEFIEKEELNEYEVTECILINKKRTHYLIKITRMPLDMILYDGGAFFALAMFHEFCHLTDFYYMMQTNQFKINLCRDRARTYDDKYASEGFGFWTEVLAYYKTIDFCKLNHLKFEGIKFSKLVKVYNDVLVKQKELVKTKEILYAKLHKYLRSVESFIYLCAKFIGLYFGGKAKVPYAKIDENKDYKKVYKILLSLQTKTYKIFKNPYGKKAKDNLCNLGNYIWVNIKWKVFNVMFNSHEGYMDDCVCLEEGYTIKPE